MDGGLDHYLSSWKCVLLKEVTATVKLSAFVLRRWALANPQRWRMRKRRKKRLAPQSEPEQIIATISTWTKRQKKKG